MVKKAICGRPAREGHCRINKIPVAVHAHPPRTAIRQLMLAMKLTFALLTITFLHVSAKSLSQSVTFSGKNVSLEKVFESVEKQTGFVFLYPDNIFKQTRPVSIDVKDLPLEEFMKQVLEGRPLRFILLDRTIIISPRTKNNNFPEMLEAYVRDSIRGRVLNASGEPLGGATILNRQTKMAVLADAAGNFSIAAQEGETLLISFIGYQPFEYKAGRQPANITLARAISSLDTAVVAFNTGYQRLPKERITGSFSFVDNKLFNNRISSDILSRLEGNVPGLVFNKNTTQALYGGDINIQGHSTLYSNDQPLIVVDNFPYDGDISKLNPNDVLSITVLKDAAAASIWGVRSGNGVIVITTKRGKRGQALSTGFTANVTVTPRPDLYYSRRFIASPDYIGIEQQLFESGYYDTQLTDPTASVSPVITILNDRRNGRISAAEATAQLDALKLLDYRDQATKYLYQTGVAQQYAVNVSGGSERSDYYLSAGYDRALSNTVGNQGNRITLNSKYRVYPTDRLQVSVEYNYLQDIAKNNGNINLFNTYPYAQLAGPTGKPLAVDMGDYNNRYRDSMMGLGFLDWNYRPLEDIRLSDNKTLMLSNRVTAGINYRFLDGLTGELSYQYQRETFNTEDYSSLSTFNARNIINMYTQIDANGVLSYPVPLGGIMRYNQNMVQSHLLRAQAAFNHVWQQIHELNVIAGAEIRRSMTEGSSNIQYGYDKSTGTIVGNMDFNTYFPMNPYGSGQIPNYPGVRRNVSNFLSYYANASYTFNNKYSLSASARTDQTNFFGLKTNQKGVPLYSLGLAWNLSNEGFYHFNLFTMLRPRATFGYTGNVNPAATAVTTISQGINAPITNQPFADIANPGNPELRWERQRKINLAVDFTTRNNILSGSVDVFFKRGIDLFGSSPLAPASGWQEFFGNTASTKGNGVDINITSRNIYGEKFKWTSTFLMGYVKDRVTKYNVKSSVIGLIQRGAPQNDVVPLEGALVFGVYSYRWAGLDPSNGDPMGYVGNKPSKDYSAIMSNNSFDSLHFNGPARPLYNGSLRNTFSYGPVSISVNITYSLDYYFKRFSASTIGSVHSDYYKRWQKPGDEAFTDVPSFQYPPFNYNRSSFYNYSSALISRGDHIRLQDVSVNYELGRQQWKASPFENLTVSCYIDNLGILWRANKHGLEPQLNADRPIKPRRSFAFGIRTNF